MILINLLPPELRRRHSAVNPVFLGLAGAAVLCVLLIASYFWLGVEIKRSRGVQADRMTELAAVTASADQVRALESTIDENKKRRSEIFNLLAHKVYWARTIDEFVTLLNGPWQPPAGFDVRCESLSISQASAANRVGNDDAISFDFNWRYKLLGKERPLSGAYMHSFMSTIMASKFWSEQGFTGKPEDTYGGDHPVLNTAIQRTIIEGTLQWHRVKVIKDPTGEGR